MKSLFGSFESNGNFCSVIRSIIEECPSLFPRVFAFFVLFFLSPMLLLLQKSWCCWVLLRTIEEYYLSRGIEVRTTGPVFLFLMMHVL
jgi:hypothetical protein